MNTRIFSSLFTALLLLGINLTAQSQDYTWTTNGGTITITGYTGPGGDVVIPDTITGLSVTEIGNNAFSFDGSVTNVIIPDSVTSIGDRAFQYCTSLTSVTIPDSVTSIGFAAFYRCTSLTSVTIPDSVTSIGGGAFQSCDSLTAITVDTNNPAYSSVDGVLFNQSQTALIQCPGARAGSYTIPNSVTSIGDAAFAECTSLTSVTIPDSVTSIGFAAFRDCTSLTAITVDTNNPAYSSVDGVLFNQSQTALIQCPGARAGSYTIPNSVTSIGGGGAFYRCSGLTSVTIPNSVTSIGGNTFAGCTSLTSVTIPDSVTSIGDRAFQYCTSLTGVYFLGNAPSLGSDVFFDANNATVYYLAGTTGWGATFGGRPTVLWNPHVQTAAPTFGAQPTGFGLPITGTPAIPIVLEAATNLTGSDWTPLLSGTLTNGSILFTDPDWTNHPARFYRIRSP